MIPKNLIQLVIGEETNTHKYWLHLSKGWAKAYPHWNHKVYRDDDVEKAVRGYSKELWEMYKSCHIMTYKTDIARLALLYSHGGLYVDSDSRPGLDLDTYVIHSDDIKWGMIISLQTIGGAPELTANTYIAAAEKNSEMIKYMLDSMIEDFNKLSPAESKKDRAWRFPSIVSTNAWGKLIKNKLNKMYDGDYISYHSTEKQYGVLGNFWITWNGDEIKIRKDRGFLIHIGSLLIKDFLDVTPETDSMKKIAELYSNTPPHDGEIKIYSRGLDGI